LTRSAAIVVTNSQKEIKQRVPSTNGTWMNYTWDYWEQSRYHERLKKSYDILQNAYKEAEAGD
jgi:hypothetical protein